MKFRLVEDGWINEFTDALRANNKQLSIICPFIKERTVRRLLADKFTQQLRVITRFSLCDFAEGVSDLSALHALMEHGAEIRGVRNLHSKMYLFGQQRAIVSSANLTEAALSRNHEFGFVADEPLVVTECNRYFESLWARAGKNLDRASLSEWREITTACLAQGATASSTYSLPDFGVNINGNSVIAPLIAEHSSTPVAEASQAYIKFFGTSKNRAPRLLTILDEIKRSGSNRNCTYPQNKRPRSVQDGALLFMSRLVKDPPDIIIYGRAIGMKHVEGRDEASPADIAFRPWKESWPNYIRVHHPEFIAGTLQNGISLNEFMDELGHEVFASTLRNFGRGTGNIEPRKAFSQQAAVELSAKALTLLNARLNHRMLLHGRLPQASLDEVN